VCPERLDAGDDLRCDRVAGDTRKGGRVERGKRREHLGEDGQGGQPAVGDDQGPPQPLSPKVVADAQPSAGPEVDAGREAERMNFLHMISK
jgi:hypothetical protein